MYLMKTLILFRHGKSDWDHETGDHERPLAKRGLTAARTMGRLLSLAGEAPDSIVTSSATRARTSVELAREAGPWEAPVRVTRSLYEATPHLVMEELKAEPDSTSALLMAGHQPTWSELTSLLISGGVVPFPTAAMARVDLSISSWKDAARGTGELVWFIRPKLFTNGNFDFAGK